MVEYEEKAKEIIKKVSEAIIYQHPELKIKGALIQGEGAKLLEEDIVKVLKEVNKSLQQKAVKLLNDLSTGKQGDKNAR
jgi:hypothetical protein